MSDEIKKNEVLWDAIHEQFADASALPVWGPFGVGENLDLIPDIENKIFLEVGCGSGRSLKYLADRGAKKVYGLDFSEKQIEASARCNEGLIKKGQVKLFKAPMEERVDIEQVDVVFSIYAIGWTSDPERTLSNIYFYLKPGGSFVWSWDHTFFKDVQYKDGDFVVTYAYHDEKPIAIKDWKTEGHDAHLTYRKTSTWFKLLAEAEFQVAEYHEPKPVNLLRGYEDPEEYYSIQKAEKVPATFIFVCRKPK